MSRPKTKRLLATFVLLLACAGGVAAGFVLWQRQVEAGLLRSRASGIDAVKADRYAEGLHAIGRYLQRHPSDPEALLHYATARLRVEEPDGSHVRQTTRALRRALDLRPTDLPAQHLLLQTYLGAGFHTEAMDVADAILSNHPADPVALRGKARVLLHQRRADEALQVSIRCNDVAPHDLAGQILTLQILAGQNARPDQIVARTVALRKAHGDDPRFLLLQSIAHSLAAQFEAARRYAVEAAEGPLSGTDLVDPLVRQLDDLELFEESFTVLTRAADEQAALEPRRQLVARLWENDQADQIVRRLKTLDHAGGDTELLAFRALALARLGRRQQAEADVAALAARRADSLALAWASVLPVLVLRDDPHPREVIRVVTPALPKLRRAGWLHDQLGQAYARLGEEEAAARQWAEAIQVSRSWARPLDRLARMLLSGNRADEAVEAASAAARRAPEDPEVLATLVSARMANLGADEPSKAQEVMDLARHVQKLRPNEPRSLEVLVRLLLREGRRDKAMEQMRGALIGEPPPVPAFLQFAELSREEGMGLEGPLLDACETAHGLTPHLALVRAEMLAEDGRADEGLRLLESAVVPSEPGWRLVHARYLDRINAPSAERTWINLAEDFPDVLDVQWEALNARAVRGNRAFLGQTIERLRGQLGEQAVSWQLARARWLLGGPADERSSAEAAMLLGQVSRHAPHLLGPRLLLADCLSRLGDREGAIEQLTLAAEAQPASFDAQLRLAQLLQERGELERADRYLSAVLSGESASPDQRREAVRLLAQRDRPVNVLRLLEEAQARTGQPWPADVALASLYREWGETDKAEQIYLGLLAERAPDAAVIKEASDFFADQGDWEQAERAIARLHDVEAPPGVKELVRGEYLFRRAGTGEAEAQFKAATTAAPRNPVMWLRLVAHYLVAGHGDKAVEAAEAALQQVPDGRALRLIQQHPAVVVEAAADPMARPLLLAVLRPGHETGEIDALQAIVEVRREGQGPAQLAERLEPISKANPGSLALQLALIKACDQAGDAQRGVAAAVRTAEAFPAAGEPAGMAAGGLARLGRWFEAARAAERWKQRSPADAYRADLIIATAQLAQGHPGQAARQIEPHMKSALARPERVAEATLIYARAQIEMRRPDRADALLVPLLRQSSKARVAWVRLAGRQLDARGASDWLRRMGRLSPATSLQEQVVLAEAWQSLENRFAGQFRGDVDRSMQSAMRTATAGNATPCDLLSLAMLLERGGKLAEAESIFRRVLAMQPLPVAQNNLAMLLLRRGGDLNEALTLARAAADSRHPLSDQFLETLAQVRAARKEYEQAARTMALAVRMRPEEPAWQIRLAALLLEDGQVQQAREVLGRIGQLERVGSRLNEEDLRNLSRLRARLILQVGSIPAKGT